MAEECKLLADASRIFLPEVQLKARGERQHLLLYGAHLPVFAIVYLQAMPPGGFALDRIDRITRIVVYILSVEPGKHSLLKKQSHNKPPNVTVPILPYKPAPLQLPVEKSKKAVPHRGTAF